MAKISANHSHKVEELSYDFPVLKYSWREHKDVEGHYRHFWVLRSDGAVLLASADPEGETAYDRKRSGYKLMGRIPKDAADQQAFFRRYVEKRCQRVNGVMR